MSDVFISYARETAAYAKNVADALRAGGFSVWYDDDLPAHRAFSEVIEERLREAKAVIVIWSTEAVKSQWVRAEANIARESGTLVQLKVDKTELPLPFREIQCVDLAGWSGNADAAGWRRIIGSVEELVGQRTQQPSMAARSRSRTLTDSLLFRRWAMAAALVLLIAAGAAFYLTRSPNTPEPARAATASMRVAVIPFDVIGPESDTTRAFADTLLDKIVGALSANQVESISRTGSLALRDASATMDTELSHLGVGLTLEGSVQNSGKIMTVRLHLDDPREHVTLWSKDFQGPADSPEALQTTIALHATDVTRWAVSPRLRTVWSDRSLVAAYLEGQDEETNGGGGRSLAIARDLIARAPNFAAAHTLLAEALSNDTSGVAPTAAAISESSQEARIAAALDNRSGDAYGQLALNLPIPSWEERERWALKGLAVDPGGAIAYQVYIYSVLDPSGRITEAIAAAQDATRIAPFTAWIAEALSLTLADAGRIDEARAVIVEMKRKWPDWQRMPLDEYAVESRNPPFARAQALLDDPVVRNYFDLPPFGQQGTTDALRTVMKARVGSPTDRRAATQRVEKMADEGTMNPILAIAVLSSVDVDASFRVADLTLTSEKLRHVGSEEWNFGLLFSTLTNDLRRDRRFMQLAQRLGLIDYWRTSGHWPDFCSEPGLPYDCKAEAAKLTAHEKTTAPPMPASHRS